jgi:hypothetical protein
MSLPLSFSLFAYSSQRKDLGIEEADVGSSGPRKGSLSSIYMVRKYFLQISSIVFIAYIVEHKAEKFYGWRER